jgi:hypothetical protein
MSVPKRFKSKQQKVFLKKKIKIFIKTNKMSILSKYSNFLSAQQKF